MLVFIPNIVANAKGEMNERENNKKATNEIKGDYNSRSALVMDYDTGKVLYERNADAKYPIASMVKIMTLNIVFEEIEKGSFTFEDKTTISDNASGMGGSQMFLDKGLEYSIADLIKGVTVVSANDASVALAEKVCGNVETFIDLMNQKAGEYDMINTRFVNVTGLPQDGQYSTARDVSKMMKKLLNHPKYYQFSNIYLENYTHPDGRITELTNTNKLVRFYAGCDGGKTGFTSDAMFCLSATAKRDNTRVIATVLGAPSSKERNKEITELFNYAFANYRTIKVVEKNAEIPTELTVKGANNKIKLCSNKDMFVLSKRGNKPNFDVQISINNNLKAPIPKGEIIGSIRIVDNISNEIIDEGNLITLENISSKSYLESLKEILQNWFLAS